MQARPSASVLESCAVTAASVARPCRILGLEPTASCEEMPVSRSHCVLTCTIGFPGTSGLVKQHARSPMSHERSRVRTCSWAELGPPASALGDLPLLAMRLSQPGTAEGTAPSGLAFPAAAGVLHVLRSGALGGVMLFLITRTFFLRVSSLILNAALARASQGFRCGM